MFDEPIRIPHSSRPYMSTFRILLVLMSMVAVAAAQTNTPAMPTRQLTLQEAIELALTNNLGLQIERYNPQIAGYTLAGAYGGYDPTISASGQHDHTETGQQLLGGGFAIPASRSDDNSFSSGINGFSPIGTTYSISGRASDSYGATGGRDFENSSGSGSFSLSQPLLRNFWIDSTRLNIRVAKNRVKWSEQNLRLSLMQTLTLVEQAFYELIYSRENLVVQQKAVELADRLVSENEKRLEVGALAPLDLESARAQAATTRAAVIQARISLETQERVVKALITDKFRQEWAYVSLDPVGSLTAPIPFVDRQDSWSKGLSQRPDIQQAKLDIERQGIQLKYSYNQLLPELDVFGTYGYNGSGKEFTEVFNDIRSTDRRFYTYGGRINVPLLNLTARNAYKSNKAAMQQLVLGLKQLEQQTLVLIDNDIGTIVANYDQVKATRAAREYQEKALEAEQKKLENGKSTTYTVLQVQRDLTAARGNEIQALDAYNRSLSQLSLHEGSTLQRLGVNLEVQ